MSVKLRLGSVSYLNARPLIWGLEHCADLEIRHDVPSRLPAGLREGRFNLALLPVIDYQRIEDLRLLPGAAIGCDGPALTVRIFSQVPLERIGLLACDSESHTSVALARVILAERYGVRPELAELKSDPGANEARLLIGDKVILQEPVGFPHQLDLGLAWKQLTGLPFVFAAWMARDGSRLGDLPQRLAVAWTDGLAHVEQIIAQHAAPNGWPADVARRYLTEYLRYELGPRQIEAMRLFHQLSERHGMIEKPVRELCFYEE